MNNNCLIVFLIFLCFSFQIQTLPNLQQVTHVVNTPAQPLAAPKGRAKKGKQPRQQQQQIQQHQQQHVIINQPQQQQQQIQLQHQPLQQTVFINQQQLQQQQLINQQQQKHQVTAINMNTDDFEFGPNMHGELDQVKN